MGTTSITIVKLNGKIRIAQPRWHDGYPYGEGIDILKFLLKGFNREKLTEKLLIVRTAESYDEENDREQRQKDYEGIKILKYLLNKKDYIIFNGLEDENSVDTYEYAYLIDLDNNAFEIYAENEYSHKYKNVRKQPEFKKYNLLRIYKFDNLPTLEQFKETFDMV